MDRNSTLLNLRLKLDLEETKEGSLEHFQNQVLRPILKFQNDLVIEYIDSHPQFVPLKSKINHQDIKSYQEVLIKFIKSNNAFRNQLYGMIVGMMTKDEYQVYLKDKSEYNRRIVSMYLERVLSQIE